MAFFGRKKAPVDPERWNGWPETLDVENAVDVDWIKRSNDPLVWHAAALSCLIFRGDQHGLLAWLVRQPTLDRVTAAAMFLHGSNGAHRLRGEPLELPRLTEPEVEAMIDPLCDLDAMRTLADNGIGMDPAWETARLETVSALAADPRTPMRVLQNPIDRQTAKMPYADIGEGDLVSQKWMRENMPYLFD